MHIARNLAESGALENVVEVVQNRVDPRELIEDADGDCKEDGLAVTRLEQRLPSCSALPLYSFGDFLQGVFWVLFSQVLEYLARLLLSGPSRSTIEGSPGFQKGQAEMRPPGSRPSRISSATPNRRIPPTPPESSRDKPAESLQLRSSERARPDAHAWQPARFLRCTSARSRTMRQWPIPRLRETQSGQPNSKRRHNRWKKPGTERLAPEGSGAVRIDRWVSPRLMNRERSPTARWRP